MNRIHGINLPYFFDAYGHDLAPNAVIAMGPGEIDPMRIYAALLAARERGFRAVRVWLCEGAEGILMDAGVISGAHPVLVESVAIIQECASLSGLRLYWTLLDAHSCRRTGDQVSKAILTVRDEAGRFAERVAAPLVRRLDSGLTLAVEVVNEPEALSTEAGPPGSSTAAWEALGVAIRTIAEAVRAENGKTLVTAGAHRAALTALWRNAPGLTAIDVHRDAQTQLPSRAEVMAVMPAGAVRDDSMPLLSGSCGATATQADGALDDYSALFFWRLTEDLIASPISSSRIS
jgi:hypothetical protein